MEQVKIDKGFAVTEFYKIAPTQFFYVWDLKRKNKRSLCFKVTENSYLDIEKKEYVILKDDLLEMWVDVEDDEDIKKKPKVRRRYVKQFNELTV